VCGLLILAVGKLKIAYNTVTWNTAVSFHCRFPCITSRTVRVRQQIHVYIVQKITWHCWRPDSRLKPIPGDDAIFCVRSNADYWQASMLNVGLRHRADMIMGWVDPCLGWVGLGWVSATHRFVYWIGVLRWLRLWFNLPNDYCAQSNYLLTYLLTYMYSHDHSIFVLCASWFDC